MFSGVYSFIKAKALQFCVLIYFCVLRNANNPAIIISQHSRQFLLQHLVENIHPLSQPPPSFILICLVCLIIYLITSLLSSILRPFYTFLHCFPADHHLILSSHSFIHLHISSFITHPSLYDLKPLPCTTHYPRNVWWYLPDSSISSYNHTIHLQTLSLPALPDISSSLDGIMHGPFTALSPFSSGITGGGLVFRHGHWSTLGNLKDIII